LKEKERETIYVSKKMDTKNLSRRGRGNGRSCIKERERERERENEID